MSAASKRRLLRRILPGWIVLGAMAVLAARQLSRMPSEVTVRYRWGAAGVGLVRAKVAYQRQGEVLRRVRWRFSETVPVTSENQVKLPDGLYDVIVELHYRDAVPTTIRRRGVPLAPHGLRLRRTLPVRGSATVEIIIADAL